MVVPGWPLVQVSLKVLLRSKWSADEWINISRGTDFLQVSGVLINFGVSIVANVVWPAQQNAKKRHWISVEPIVGRIMRNIVKINTFLESNLQWNFLKPTVFTLFATIRRIWMSDCHWEWETQRERERESTVQQSLGKALHLGNGVAPVARVWLS